MSVSSPSCHNHDSYEEGYRQWLEIKTMLQFLCRLEGQTFSGLDKEFSRSLGKRRRVFSEGQTF